MKRIIAACFILGAIFAPRPAKAAKAVMEGITSSNQVILVDTSNARVDMSTTSAPPSSVSNVGLYTSSNVVVSASNSSPNCVIYATGSITCLGTVIGGASTNLSVSSFTSIPSQTITNNSGNFNGCSISTITIVLPRAENLIVGTNSSWGNAGCSATLENFYLLMDSNFISGENSTTPIYSGASIGGQSNGFSVILENISSGSHVFCFGSNQGGTCANSLGNSGVARFWVQGS